MLNVQTDDYGVVEERHCGCELESLGYTTHLREIRSYSKLTGEGVTLIGTEMLEILNHSLPARFGGTLLDYQLMEAEDAQGFTRLYLIISPRVAIDGRTGGGGLHAPAAQPVLADGRCGAGAVATRAHHSDQKRMEPVWTERGKLLATPYSAPSDTLRRRRRAATVNMPRAGRG